jgi:hypothetical protein
MESLYAEALVRNELGPGARHHSLHHSGHLRVVAPLGVAWCSWQKPYPTGRLPVACATRTPYHWQICNNLINN